MMVIALTICIGIIAGLCGVIVGDYNLSQEQSKSIAWLREQLESVRRENRALVESIGYANRTPIRFENKLEQLQHSQNIGGYYDKQPMGGSIIPESVRLHGMNP